MILEPALVHGGVVAGAEDDAVADGGRAAVVVVPDSTRKFSDTVRMHRLVEQAAGRRLADRPVSS